MWVVAMLALASGAISAIGPLLVSLLFCAVLNLAAALLRCVNCGKSLFLHAISKQPANQWLNWLAAVHECPTCGYVASDTPASTGQFSDQSP
ncbi:MAG TPA: hypothetical protein VN201_01890 [Roseateles sp.]|nr:hypothetical protein [Roseateles sp.]